jgi:Spy/CpxP family protein refolding chaperone
MRNSIRLGITFAAMLAFAAPAYSQETGDPSSKADPVAIYQEAGATPAQQDKIRELAREFEKGAKVKHERIKNLLNQMQNLSLDAEPNEQKVLATQEEINTLTADMANTRIKLMLSIRQVLNGEQKTRLVQLMKERNARYRNSLTAH